MEKRPRSPQTIHVPIVAGLPFREERARVRPKNCPNAHVSTRHVHTHTRNHVHDTHTATRDRNRGADQNQTNQARPEPGRARSRDQTEMGDGRPRGAAKDGCCNWPGLVISRQPPGNSGSRGNNSWKRADRSRAAPSARSGFSAQFECLGGKVKCLPVANRKLPATAATTPFCPPIAYDV